MLTIVSFDLSPNKQARKYILDPLTAPEPSQETGPGTSFFNPRRSLSYRAKEPPPTIRNRRNSGYPTPPHSASPSRSSFHPSNPFSSTPSPRVPTRPPTLPQFDWAPASAILARKPSFESESSGEKPPTPRSPEGPSARYLEKRPAEDKPLPQRPQRHASERYTLRVPEKLARRSLDQPAFETQRHYQPQTLVRRASERQPLRVPEKLAPQSPERRSPDWYQNRNIGRSKTLRYPPQTHYTQGSADNFEAVGLVSRSNSLTTSNLNKLNSSNPFSLQRSSSLSQRYHGDMSHRPLDMIKRENRAADRAPHLRRHKAAVTDTIDSLDQSAIGGAYHHGGPYDATLASRNTNKLYSPVEAVKESNIEALKATPNEFINDSITKHVPLQGTAIVPPGMADMGGHVMNYEEGADLMREADAPGGAYRRWDFIVSDMASACPTPSSAPVVADQSVSPAALSSRRS